MQRFRGEACVVVFDDAYWPLLFVTYQGRLDVRAIDAYFDAQAEATARAKRHGDRLVVITDALDIERPPPIVRRRIAERTDALDFGDTHAASFVVLKNAFVRGALTAVQWVAKGGFDVQYVGTCEEAIERALAVLDELGHPRPDGLSPETYRRPL